MNAIGTWEIDLKQDTITCSRGMLELWGIEPEELKGNRQALQAKVHPDDLEGMKLAIDIAIIECSIYELEFRIIPEPGVVRWVRSRGECVFDDGPGRPTRFVGRVYLVESYLHS